MKLRTIRDVMDTETHAILDTQPVLAAIRLLIRDGVTDAPVVDDTGALVGMITEAACLDLLTGQSGGDVPEGIVADYMEPAQTVGPEMDVHYAAGVFRNQRNRRLVVVGGGRLLGVVTRKDILRALDANFDDPRFRGTPAPAPRR